MTTTMWVALVGIIVGGWIGFCLGYLKGEEKRDRLASDIARLVTRGAGKPLMPPRDKSGRFLPRRKW